MTGGEARNAEAGLGVLGASSEAERTVASCVTRATLVAHMFGARDLAVFGASGHLGLPLVCVLAAAEPASVLGAVRALADALRATHSVSILAWGEVLKTNLFISLLGLGAAVATIVAWTGAERRDAVFFLSAAVLEAGVVIAVIAFLALVEALSNVVLVTIAARLHVEAHAAHEGPHPAAGLAMRRVVLEPGRLRLGVHWDGRQVATSMVHVVIRLEVLVIVWELTVVVKIVAEVVVVPIDYMRGALGQHRAGPVVASHAVSLLLFGHAIGLLLLGGGVHDLVVVVDAMVVDVEDWVIMHNSWLCFMHCSGSVLMGNRLRNGGNTVALNTVVMRDWLRDNCTVCRSRMDNWLAHYSCCAIGWCSSNILMSYWLRDYCGSAVSGLGNIFLNHGPFHAVHNLMVDNIRCAVLRHRSHGDI